MIPALQDLQIYRGDTFRRRVTLDGDQSSWSWAAQIRATTEAETILATFTIDTTNAADGAIELRLAPSVTKGLAPGSAVWDLQRYTGGETDVDTILAGKVKIEADVTRLSED